MNQWEEVLDRNIRKETHFDYFQASEDGIEPKRQAKQNKVSFFNNLRGTEVKTDLLQCPGYMNRELTTYFFFQII